MEVKSEYQVLPYGESRGFVSAFAHGLNLFQRLKQNERGPQNICQPRD